VEPAEGDTVASRPTLNTYRYSLRLSHSFTISNNTQPATTRIVCRQPDSRRSRYLHVLSLSPSPLPTPTALDHSLHTLLRFSPIKSMSKLPQDMQLATVQSAGREQFFGDALTAFDRVATAAENPFDPLNHYSRFMPIVQSSGMGKSRLIDQYATKILNPSQTAGHV
jgi:hypothetical protein